MRIVLFISALSGGGAERVVCNLANHLSKRGHNIEIMTMGSRMPAEELDTGIKEIVLLSNEEKSNVIKNNIKRIVRLKQFMKKENVDAYVVMLPKLIQMMLFFAGTTNAPIIVSERADPSKYSMQTQRGIRMLISRASGIVFQMEDASRWYAPYLSEQICKRIIPNAINPTFIRPPYTGKRERTVVAAGRLNQQKNFGLLIRAFAKNSKDFPEYRLIIYGQGEKLDELKKLASELEVDDKVDFPGYVENMAEHLEKASMFVLSSNYEGMPNALMEAMAVGVPCISTDCDGGGARFLIENGVNGLLVPKEDVDVMADAMKRIINEKELAEYISHNARKLQEELSAEKIYGQWEELIKEVVEKGLR